MKTLTNKIAQAKNVKTALRVINLIQQQLLWKRLKSIDMKKFIRIEKVKKFLEKKELAKTKTLKRKHQRKNKKLGLLI